MGDLSIKIKILDREYPMRASANEEERLRKAGKAINEQLRMFRAQFGLDDKQDLLAMVAIVCMAEKLKLDESEAQLQHTVTDKIIYLDKLITSSL